jgi:hypothetical protein
MSGHVSVMPSSLDYDALDNRLTMVEERAASHERKFMQVLQFVRRVGGASTSSPITSSELDSLKDQVSKDSAQHSKPFLHFTIH